MWTWLKIFNVWDIISKCAILNHFWWLKILECMVFWRFAIFMNYASFFCTWCLDFPYVFWVLIFALLQVSHVLVWRLCIFWKGCYVIKFMCVDKIGCRCWYGNTWHLSNFGLHQLYLSIPHLNFGGGLVQFKEPPNIGCVNTILANLREAYYNNKTITQNN